MHEDPIGFAGGQNVYSYANGNPVLYGDPTGNCPPCLIILVPVAEALGVEVATLVAGAVTAAEVGMAVATDSPAASPVAATEAFIGRTGKAAEDLAYDVYLAYKNGKVVYVGITNDLLRRTCQHALKKRGFDAYEKLTSLGQVTRDQARGIEQHLIETLNGLENELNSIGAVRDWYPQAKAWGETWYKNLGR